MILLTLVSGSCKVAHIFCHGPRITFTSADQKEEHQTKLEHHSILKQAMISQMARQDFCKGYLIRFCLYKISIKRWQMISGAEIRITGEALKAAKCRDAFVSHFTLE